MDYKCDQVDGYDYKTSTMAENRDLLYHFTTLTEPELIVELGTYYGASYFAFAQAIIDDNIKTKLYGVDTWEGDVHTGFYGDDVFKHFVRVLHDKYGSDERLSFYRAPFEFSVDRFKDDSINALMIDGLHTYQASKHDFDTWLPKLAQNGTVFFHDINVNDFGVGKLWEQLRAKYPHFEVKNENGLGMLFPKGMMVYNRLFRDNFYQNFIKVPKQYDKRVAIYTSVFGDYDVPQKHIPQTIPVDFLLFTDTNYGRMLNGYHVVQRDVPDETTPRMKSKWFKIEPHHIPVLQNYDYTIYIDGHVKILRPGFAEWAVKLVEDSGIAMFKHPDRNCVWDEYEAVKQHGKFTDGEPPQHLLDHLTRMQYPKNNGLYAGTVLIRNMHDPRIREFDSLWWNNIKQFSYRDQLTLPFTLWTMDLKPVTINLSLWDNPWIQYGKHVHVQNQLRDRTREVDTVKNG